MFRLYEMEISGPIQLFENDGVPGSKLDTRILQRYTTTQLRRWLECRKLPTKGNKDCLIARISNKVKTGRGHILDIGVDGGKWLEIKRNKLLQQSGTNVPKKETLPITGWRPFPGFKIPTMFNEGHIYHWIVESVPRVLPTFLRDLQTDDIDVEGESQQQENSGQESDQEDEPHYAGSREMFRRGRLYITSRFVLNVRDKVVGDKYYLKAEVRASMKMEVRYVSATISNKSGSVLDGSCTCKQRGMGRCSHVAALLLYVSKWTEDHGHSGMYLDVFSAMFPFQGCHKIVLYFYTTLRSHSTITC
ncbi:Transportin-1 [Frankliniella fusca]|uniref:Transportin-1 n=1 Tax=Frankliniella fusca TaxID=407009 RepID=A0AAE1LI84_9NEOP|nr:Transportin-1 [Frankliniella fusca]